MFNVSAICHTNYVHAVQKLISRFVHCVQVMEWIHEFES
jgi:hypothetical protein